MIKRYAYTRSRKRKDALLFIRRVRQFYTFSCLKRAILSRAKVLVDTGKKTKNGDPVTRVKYACEKCCGHFRESLVEVDHIKEMGDIANTAKWDWDPPNAVLKFTRKYLLIFLDEKNVQVLCKSCHRLKTLKMESMDI